ncbi:MAG: Coenzyme F420 hydrogenase/dehydrogenase, beta subunit C-terminal domain [Candidatus Bathyarchaeota archaeon]|nr:Coenzyme F420 hydrogenase/dehydrogenase, beta subunit C-terminal domain [Candidatus Bathyarchaeota archaeon]
MLPKNIESQLIGSFIYCYLGCSEDKHVRWAASSGGAVTSILMFMLKEKMIDGALVVKMEGLKPRPFIARSPEDLIIAMGSKYLPVSITSNLRELLEYEGRYAVVGLPCHIRFLKKVLAGSKGLQERIVLLLGLFCCRVISPPGFKVLLRKLNIREDDVKDFKFRGCGWPGKLHVNLINGRSVSMPFFSYWRPLYSPYFFTPRMCAFCSDMANEEADISFGDAWLPEIMKKDSLGSSIIISRTSRAEKILQEAQRKGFIRLAKIGGEKVIEAQWRPLFFKKITLPMRVMLTRNESYRSTLNPLGLLLSSICAFLQIVNMRFSESHLGAHVIEKLPIKLLIFYATLHAILEYLSWRQVMR